MREPKLTWSDLNNATHHELKKTYKLSDRQLEMAVRKHWDGANEKERRSLYDTVYRKPK